MLATTLYPLSLSLSPSASFLIPSQRHRMTGVARGPTPRRIAARQAESNGRKKYQKRGGDSFFFYLISEMYEAQRSSRVFKDASPSVSSFIAISSSLCSTRGINTTPDRPDARSFTPGWDNARPPSRCNLPLILQ